jgi:hypothetical protein
MLVWFLAGKSATKIKIEPLMSFLLAKYGPIADGSPSITDTIFLLGFKHNFRPVKVKISINRSTPSAANVISVHKPTGRCIGTTRRGTVPAGWVVDPMRQEHRPSLIGRRSIAFGWRSIALG